MSRALQVMHYELQSIPQILPEDMIEVMSLQHKNEESTAELPHNVEAIATCFRSVTDKWNQEAVCEISKQYTELRQKRDRLLYYISLLENRQKHVITELYIVGRSLIEIAKDLNVTRRTVYKIREDAVKELAEMFALREQIFKVSADTSI